MLNFSEALRDTDIVSMEYQGLTHALLKDVILNELKWLSEIFVVSLQQLSFLFYAVVNLKPK